MCAEFWRRGVGAHVAVARVLTPVDGEVWWVAICDATMADAPSPLCILLPIFKKNVKEHFLAEQV